MNITRTWRSWAALGSSIAITFAMSACGGTSGNEPNAEPQRTAQSRQDGGTAASGNVLVAYFSASGNTARVAQDIAGATGGDLFHLEPADPYTDEDLDWTDASSRVNAEHEDESLRDIELVSASVDNWDDYDVVFIGYPIWWGIAAWPVNAFVTANDFTGKTVIPFCTSSSSSIGDSGALLADMAGTGDWLGGERFPSGADESAVGDWVAELGL